MAADHWGDAVIPGTERLLQRLEGVKRSAAGWRARCPACGGQGRKVAIAEAQDRVLLYCFAGCRGQDIIDAVGLQWADLMPARHWPTSPEERAKDRRALREAGWSAAVSVLTLESKIVQLAAHHLSDGQALSSGDAMRLALAIERIDHASAVMVEPRHG